MRLLTLKEQALASGGFGDPHADGGGDNGLELWPNQPWRETPFGSPHVLQAEENMEEIVVTAPRQGDFSDGGGWY